MVFELSTTILLSGVLQGLLLGGFIYIKSRDQIALKFLAFAIVLASLNTFLFSIEKLHYLIGCPLCNLLTRLTFFLFGPLIYLFIYSKTQGKKPNKYFLLHFLPFLFLGILSIFAYRTPNIANDGVVRMFLPIHFNTTYFYELLRIGHILMYGLLSYRIILPSSHINTEEKNWLKHFVIVGTITYCVVAITLKLNYYSGNPAINQFHVMFLTIPLFIYYTTYKVLGLQDFKFGMKKRTKYKSTKIKNPEIVSKKLKYVMETEKVYLEPNVSLNLVAMKLNISRHQLSQFLNSELGLKFNDYINQMRVTDAQELIRQTADDLTLEAIGMNVGFKSKTTFISAFKKHLGMTPGEYRTRLAIA